MARGRRRTRKQLLKREDQFLTTSTRVMGFLTEHQRPFLALLTAILLLGGLYGAYTLYSNRQERQAAITLYQERPLFTPLLTKQKLDPAEARTAIAKLQELVHRYPHTASALQASYYLGHLQYRIEDYKAAVTSFARVVSRASSPMMRELALMNLGAAQEALGDYRSAITTYQKVVMDQEALLRDRALDSVARCYELLGDHSKAIQNYKGLLDQYPNSPWSRDAKEALTRLQPAR